MRLKNYFRTLRWGKLRKVKNIEEIHKECKIEWRFIYLVRQYMYLMRENVVFIYPIAPANITKYLKVISSYNSFDYMVVRETDKSK